MKSQFFHETTWFTYRLWRSLCNIFFKILIIENIFKLARAKMPRPCIYMRSWHGHIEHEARTSKARKWAPPAWACTSTAPQPKQIGMHARQGGLPLQKAKEKRATCPRVSTGWGIRSCLFQKQIDRCELILPISWPWFFDENRQSLRGSGSQARASAGL
jgi:hypothetical protein